MLLEAGEHRWSSFVTLTYRPEDVPWAICDGSPMQVLHGKHVSNWLKRFRKVHGPFRYFVVGEYGDKSGRPHYHAIMFGVDSARCQEIQDTWGHGFSYTREAEINAIAYTAFYTTKKWLKSTNEALLGRPPEFARMSRKPGIGFPAIDRLVESFTTRSGALAIAENRISRSIRIDGRVYPLDRGMMEKLREALGLPSSYVFGDGIEEEPSRDEWKAAKNTAKKLEAQARSHGTI